MLFNKINKNLQNILKTKPKIILGLSGGPDSVFLFYYLKNFHDENKITLICAHLDHEWRNESKQDTKFCQNLCKLHNISIFCEQTSNLCLNLKFNGSKEEIGRKLRRHFFEKLLKKQKATYIALAQHQQDQQETFFWRIIRGSSLSGLTCMKKISLPYIRPLLNISKKEIISYLENNKIKSLHDDTNESDLFLRNRIRKYVIPEIEKCDNRFSKKFESTLEQLQEEDLFLNKLTQNHFKQLFESLDRNGKTILIGDLKSFLTLDPVLQKRILIKLLIKTKVYFSPSTNFLNEALRFLKNQNGGSHQLGSNWKIYKRKKSFWIKSF